MAKKIKIEIPDDLTPHQEVQAIAKQLQGNLLIGGQQGHKQIGQGFTIKDLETHITIKRVTTEKPVLTAACNACNCEYEASLGKLLYINYGGVTRKVYYCSDACRAMVQNICGEGRTGLKKSDLKRVTLGV